MYFFPNTALNLCVCIYEMKVFLFYLSHSQPPFLWLLEKTLEGKLEGKLLLLVYVAYASLKKSTNLPEYVVLNSDL